MVAHETIDLESLGFIRHFYGINVSYHQSLHANETLHAQQLNIKR